MIHRLTMLYRTMKTISRIEGFPALFRRGLAFLADYIFVYKTYYLSELSLESEGLDASDFVPDIPDLTYHFVTSNEQTDELATQFEDFRSYHINDRQRLDKGAIALCLFIRRELAHITWMATTESAKKTFNDIPYRVNFDKKEACAGGERTIPKYRRMGLSTNSAYKKCQFLMERGITLIRAARDTNNLTAQRAFENRGYIRYAKGRHLRILWWKSWKEMPLKPDEETPPPPPKL